MQEFNNIQPIGSIHENQYRKKKTVQENKETKFPLGNLVPKSQRLVNIVCYSLNPNHYHILLEQLVDRGVEKFMHKMGLGYTNYFNEKYKRSGSLFQGTFKSAHVASNTYLLHLSVYINLNDKAHGISRLGNLVPKSSWDEYVGNKEGLCEKDIILRQFKSILHYKKFAEESLEIILRRKDMENLFLE